jgi:CopA family copper-resistance protein
VDYVIQLSDWSNERPDTIFAKLKKQSDYYNIKERTVFDFFREVQEKGFSRAWADRKMWNEMRMSDRDLSDVTGLTYTYLMNGASPAANFRVLYQPGQRVRLRVINSSAMTFFDFRIPGLKMTVVAADGQLVKPVTVDEFRIGVAETYDIVVEPKDEGPYPIFAQALDRTGFALGSLTTDPAKIAKAPPMDPLPVLTHSDMGMAMHHDGGMDHSTMSHSTMNHGASHSMGAMQGMNHGQMSHSTIQHTMGDDKVIPMDMNPKLPVSPLPIKKGPHTTMWVENPQYRLNDPGVGLRNNGRRVLTYADLKNYYPTAHWPKPTREIILHLTGNMERYMWSINGIPHEEAEPLEFFYGERLRITFINDTMMNHPMHLHGMWSDLETGDENHIPRKHTVIVQPGSKLSIRVNVDAPGRWVLHCHLLYHMGGMFREVTVIETKKA